MKTFSYNGSAGQYIEVFAYLEEHYYQEAVIISVRCEPAVVLLLFEYEPFCETITSDGFPGKCAFYGVCHLLNR